MWRPHGEPMPIANGARQARHPDPDGQMKLTSLSVLVLGAGLAIAAPVMAFDPAPPLPECPPADVTASVTCPDPGVVPPPQDGPGAVPPEADAPPRALFTRTFAAEGDVIEVDGGHRRGTLLLADAEFLRAPGRFAAYLESGDLSVRVTARTRVVDEDGDRLALDEIEPDDAVRVRGKLAPQVRWIEADDGTVTPVLVAKRVVVLDTGLGDE